MRRIPAALLLAAVVFAPAAVSAACSDDVKALKARIEKEEKRDKAKAAALQRELRPMDGPLKPGESECRNIVTRAWRILTAETLPPVCPPPPGAPYAQLEQCRELQKKPQPPRPR